MYLLLNLNPEKASVIYELLRLSSKYKELIDFKTNPDKTVYPEWIPERACHGPLPSIERIANTFGDVFTKSFEEVWSEYQNNIGGENAEYFSPREEVVFDAIPKMSYFFYCWWYDEHALGKEPEEIEVSADTFLFNLGDKYTLQNLPYIQQELAGNLCFAAIDLRCTDEKVLCDQFLKFVRNTRGTLDSGKGYDLDAIRKQIQIYKLKNGIDSPALSARKIFEKFPDLSPTMLNYTNRLIDLEAEAKKKMSEDKKESLTLKIKVARLERDQWLRGRAPTKLVKDSCDAVMKLISKLESGHIPAPLR